MGGERGMVCGESELSVSAKGRDMGCGERDGSRKRRNEDRTKANARGSESARLSRIALTLADQTLAKQAGALAGSSEVRTMFRNRHLRSRKRRVTSRLDAVGLHMYGACTGSQSSSSTAQT